VVAAELIGDSERAEETRPEVQEMLKKKARMRPIVDPAVKSFPTRPLSERAVQESFWKDAQSQQHATGRSDHGTVRTPPNLFWLGRDCKFATLSMCFSSFAFPP
jgi:hypothetical protein